MFEYLLQAPADPILGLADLYNSDERTNKINLSVGVYKDETTKTPILESVKKAERLLLDEETTKSYLPIDGVPLFNLATQKLLFGSEMERARTAQAPGGTGALRIMADFLSRRTKVKRIWVSNPSWPNHRSVFQTAGLEVREYRYYDAQNHGLDFAGLMEDLNLVTAGEAVLFHGCCHNPTGIDPTPEQWQAISELALKNGWLPLFDLAYQGFGQGIEEDVYGLRLFANHHPELLIASSYSKNFGLYNERVGAFTLIAADAEIADRSFSQVKTIIRANYSNPPAHGAKIVSYILNNDELKEEWIDELTSMRQRIHRMRQLFVKTLQDKGANQDFSFIAKQNGMFSFSGLSEEQVLKLRDNYGIYIVNSGRINVAGMTLDNMSRLCESIVDVL
ncbi:MULTISPECIES: aromatic amino acid transaminase [unclassified Gilliamella]|uniref:amino acid aminotransferase n=1 Tax=unclassified Gilliamella TaxID=2685620 RepID=UPI001C6A12AB|nr:MULTISPECIES: amino acid aminotransferase [unclassified Gilliamella]MCX8601807.1 aspartate/tyrosine/aromatic aminotransferase [Gilliamella sp. B3722]MCX8607775.1 aspartate/tyrosine/aromatic aminotransferase [Gilliamella sp. B3771]MCX8611120.1 aspartate/tyrosine/aromatic aminotransferase [Gilliamella sp. B3891]MCX8613539.1 aspartate/tyrosine/aromatic aminotransferase [Gilliamella sp. B3773]MCX8614419.1 aspartate/tyrosine/aromatic aminotransferase [Gilliamella sp. B3770]